MRSSNKRSRSKSNRPKTLGNIVNRVFDSSGPEGKVRGTPQQIIDKYLVLARDAQLSGDRVAAENFLQHAEHYTRMLSEAQRELAREAEARQQFYQQQGGQNRRHESRDDPDDSAAEGGDEAGRNRGPRPDTRQPRHEGRDQREGRENRDRGAPAVDPRDEAETGESMLVETPELRAEAAPEAVRPSEPAPEGPAETAERARKPRANARRGPRKPKADTPESSATSETPRAAE